MPSFPTLALVARRITPYSHFHDPHILPRDLHIMSSLRPARIESSVFYPGPSIRLQIYPFTRSSDRSFTSVHRTDASIRRPLATRLVIQNHGALGLGTYHTLHARSLRLLSVSLPFFPPPPTIVLSSPTTVMTDPKDPFPRAVSVCTPAPEAHQYVLTGLKITSHRSEIRK